MRVETEFTGDVSGNGPGLGEDLLQSSLHVDPSIEREHVTIECEEDFIIIAFSVLAAGQRTRRRGRFPAGEAAANATPSPGRNRGGTSSFPRRFTGEVGNSLRCGVGVYPKGSTTGIPAYLKSSTFRVATVN